MDYEQKYLKYKEKYLKLKELIGGRPTDEDFPLYCDGKKVTVVMGRRRVGSPIWSLDLLYFNDLQVAWEQIKRFFRGGRPFHEVCYHMSKLYNDFGDNARLTVAKDNDMFFDALYGTYTFENLPGGTSIPV